MWRFDRFARSVSHLLRALEQFQSLGIDFVSLSENVDTSTPTGKMIFTVLGAVAELERSLIFERVKAGIRNARAKGKKLGRPRADVRESEIETLRAFWGFLARDRQKDGGWGRNGPPNRTEAFQKCLRSLFRTPSGGALCPSELPT